MKKTLLAIFSGLILPLAFAPFNWWWLAIICPALLLFSLDEANPKAAFFHGWLFGTAFFAAGTSWVFISIYNYGNAGIVGSIVLTGLMIVGQGFFCAVMCWLLARFFGNNPLWKFVIAFPALWVCTEWIKIVFYLSFPWLFIGYTQVETPLAKLAPYIGVFGITFIAIAQSGLLFILFKRYSKRITSMTAISTVALWSILLVLPTYQWTTADDTQSFKVSLVQPNIEQTIKWSPEQFNQTLQTLNKLTHKAWQSDIIIWPENAVTAFPQQITDYLSQLSNLAERKQSALITGIPLKNEQTKEYFNGAITLGTGVGEYRKHHLVPFGETIPFYSQLKDLMQLFEMPISNFSPGPKQQPTLLASGLKVAMNICYEITYPTFVAKSSQQADVLATITNDAWFGKSIGPHQHLQMAQLRALETQKPILRGTNNGITAFINAKGEVIKALPQFQEGVLTHEVQAHKGYTPYASYQDTPILIFVLIILVSGFIRKSKRKVQPSHG